MDDKNRETLVRELFEKEFKYWGIQYVLKSDHNISLSLRYLKRIIRAMGLQRRVSAILRCVSFNGRGNRVTQNHTAVSYPALQY